MKGPIMPRPFCVMGHRGALMLAPENTLPAFELCVLAGAGIELDLRHTADGKLVVLHDNTVDRTTNGKGQLSRMSFAHVQNLDAGSWFHVDFAEEQIPTFEEVLNLVKKRQRWPIIICINVQTSFNNEQIKEVAEILAERDMFEQSFILALDDAIVPRFYAIDKGFRCASSCFDHKTFEEVLAKKHASLIWTSSNTGFWRDARIHKLGKTVYVNLVSVAGADNVNNAHAILREGADGIVTDHPLKMLQALASPLPEHE